MGRYLVFAGNDHYPLGGWDDLIGDYDSLVDARGIGRGFDWFHVVDTLTMEVVD